MFEKSNRNRKTRNWQTTVLLGLLTSGALFWWLWEVYHPLPESKSGWLIVSSFLLVLITNIVIWFLSWNYIARSTNSIKLAYGGFVGGITGLIISYPLLDNLLAMLIILNVSTIIGCGIGDSIDTEKRIIPSIVAGLIGMLWSFPLIILGAIVSNVVSVTTLFTLGSPLSPRIISIS